MTVHLRYFLGILLLIAFTFSSHIALGQLPDECKLNIGTNLSGMADWGTELPFVNLMRNSRTWYTKSIGDPENPFDSGYKNQLSFRPDGYPTHVPQTIPESPYPQNVVTIWAITDGWPSGQYTVLWEGTGRLNFWGGYENLQQTGDNRIVFDFPNPVNGIIEMTIAESDINDPIHNIRVLMPGSENTYLDHPFNPIWINKLRPFKTLRFMDWGQTNNWGEPEWDNALDPRLFSWSERSQMDHYTWAYEKGIPYEMMIELMNEYDLDGWVCIPHRASEEYIREMARLFRDQLEPERHLTVEFSNETWNFLFFQTHWLNEHGCIQQGGLTWPECIVPYIQNSLDIFSSEFEGEMQRITRVVGAFTGWPDVTRRIAGNMSSGSFDAITPTFYFGFSEEGDAELDSLGSNATINDIAYYARQGIEQGKMYIDATKLIADDLGVPLRFYEGGQHITPQPFGEEPSYAQALIDIQRDSSMYNLYNEWFAYLKTLQEGDDPLTLMHFGFVGARSARYGSWGMLEFMDQDTNLIPAPKYSAILKNLAPESCEPSNLPEENLSTFNIYPSPANDRVTIAFDDLESVKSIELLDINGKKIKSSHPSFSNVERTLEWNVKDLPLGIYIVKINQEDRLPLTKKLVIMD